MPRHRPAVTRLAVLPVVLGIGVMALLGTAPAGAADGGATAMGAGSVPAVGAVAPGWRAQMLPQINALRAAVGAAPLKPCPALRRSAQEYASLMSTSDHYGHIGPDGSQPGERMRREGYRLRAFAENIAAGQRSVEDVMAGWGSSAGHYANMINPAYRHVGLGHASSGSSEHRDYWVQSLGRGRGC